MNEMITLEAKRKQLGYEIRQQQRNEHNRLCSSHKAMFRLMDIAVVLIIIMNFGAVFLTNVLVVQKVPKEIEVVITEANPTQAKLNNYEMHPKALPLLKAFIIQAAIWALILFAYIYYRKRVWTEFQLGVMLSIVCFYFIICGRDFFNNFGYFIGKAIFRGNI